MLCSPSSLQAESTTENANMTITRSVTRAISLLDAIFQRLLFLFSHFCHIDNQDDAEDKDKDD